MSPNIEFTQNESIRRNGEYYSSRARIVTLPQMRRVIRKIEIGFQPLSLATDNERSR